MTVREAFSKTKTHVIEWRDPDIGLCGICAVDDSGNRNWDNPRDDRDSYDFDEEILKYETSKSDPDVVTVWVHWRG